MLPPGKGTQENEETCIGYIVICIYSIQPKKNNNKINAQTAKKDVTNSFFFNYNSRIIHEYFQAKIGRKIRIFSLARKNNILMWKKSVKPKWDVFIQTVIIT